MSADPDLTRTGVVGGGTYFGVEEVVAAESVLGWWSPGEGGLTIGRRTGGMACGIRVEASLGVDEASTAARWGRAAEEDEMKCCMVNNAGNTMKSRAPIVVDPVASLQLGGFGSVAVRDVCSPAAQKV